MRLGKRVKLNIAIAILLCMAFVLNIGATLAAASYRFKATSVGVDAQETYTEFANMNSASGTYAYTTGNVSNQLSLDYGFSTKYDVMVEFTATYTNTNHIANDLSLNFVNRDMWCIDMPTVTGMAVSGSTAQTYYGLASTTKTLKGVMYYLGTLEGSGTLPVLSGVTFYTSNNNSYTYIGDTLTVTLTPRYVKSTTYTSSHAFSGYLLDENNNTAFTNWYTYMTAYASDKTTVASNTFMLYNAYANNSTALSYPADFDWNSSFKLEQQQESALAYSNTAYRYLVTKAGDRSYTSVIAGNQYYGGLGVFVFPASGLTTVSISFSYNWEGYNETSQKYEIESTIPINPVHLNYNDDEITTIYEYETDEDGEYVTDEDGQKIVSSTSYYYSSTISKPTYIDVLDYIMLTAEAGYLSILQNDYKLVIHNFEVTAQTSEPSGWTSKEDMPTYEVNNSTEQSPILVRIKDVAAESKGKQYQANVSFNNYGVDTLAVKSFNVKGLIWYGDYNQDLSVFNQTTAGWLPDGALIYDDNIWTATFDSATNTHKFTRANASAHVPAGYGVSLITGVVVPQQSYQARLDALVNSTDTIEVNDLWCTLQITDVETEEPTYNATNYTGVEVVTNAYYSKVEKNSLAYIYVRNNTNQNITSVTISNLTLAQVTSNGIPVRDNINSTTVFSYDWVDYGDGTTSSTGSSSTAKAESTSITIRPNEMYLLYQIKPSMDAVIYTYNISVTLSSGKVESDVNLVVNSVNNTANITNVSSGEDKVHYEFRLKLKPKTGVNVSTYLVNSNDFVVSTSATNGYYYVYYKGVVCAGQMIQALTNISEIGAIEIDAKQHVDGCDASNYVSSNYNTWVNEDTSGAVDTWLTTMQAIYGEPEREAD